MCTSIYKFSYLWHKRHPIAYMTADCIATGYVLFKYSDTLIPTYMYVHPQYINMQSANHASVYMLLLDACHHPLISTIFGTIILTSFSIIKKMLCMQQGRGWCYANNFIMGLQLLMPFSHPCLAMYILHLFLDFCIVFCLGLLISSCACITTIHILNYWYWYCYYVVVVTSKDLRRSGDIWVCPNADHVCTRFFFVYDDISSTATFDTRKSQCKKEIDHAVEHIRNFKRRKANSTKPS